MILSWIKYDLILALYSGPRLLTLNVISFHISDEVKVLLKSHDITYSYIPPSYTSLVQLLDVTVNKFIKAILWEIVDEEMDQEPQKWLNNGFSVGDRCICMIKCVAEVWDILHRDHAFNIQSSFCKVGLSLPIDGNCDNELSVKNMPFEVLRVGDWRQDLNTVIDVAAETEDENVDFVAPAVAPGHKEPENTLGIGLR
ncbi:hypothetical protein EV426DRAFT_717374 [Tirmania nivea]|nr:hypothetical protein EV426DRAFT_717374 [Tirmania nivea]